MDDAAVALLVTGSNVLTSVATALVTARKAKSDAKVAEDKAFSDRYSELYKQMNTHLANIQKEQEELKTEHAKLKKDHEDCNERSLEHQAEINTLKAEVQMLKINRGIR